MSYSYTFAFCFNSGETLWADLKMDMLGDGDRDICQYRQAESNWAALRTFSGFTVHLLQSWEHPLKSDTDWHFPLPVTGGTVLPIWITGSIWSSCWMTDVSNWFEELNCKICRLKCFFFVDYIVLNKIYINGHIFSLANKCLISIILVVRFF